MNMFSNKKRIKLSDIEPEDLRYFISELYDFLDDRMDIDNNDNPNTEMNLFTQLESMIDMET